MKFKDYLNESKGDVVEDTIKVLKSAFKEERISSTLVSNNKIEIESHYDDEIYHVTVSPLEVDLLERNDVLKSYSLVSNTAKEIADLIITQLQKYEKK